MEVAEKSKVKLGKMFNVRGTKLEARLNFTKIPIVRVQLFNVLIQILRTSKMLRRTFRRTLEEPSRKFLMKNLVSCYSSMRFCDFTQTIFGILFFFFILIFFQK